MNIFGRIIPVLWLVLLAYWLISATHAKRSIATKPRWRGAGLRAVIIAIIFLFIRVPAFRRIYARFNHAHQTGVASIYYLDSVGVFLCAAGVIFAICARVYLGRNWGMPMSAHEDSKLITSGPYRWVRHPIYAGFLLAMLGSALVYGVIWFTIFILCGIYFIYSAKTEEKLMAKQFPEEYPAYMKRTKAFIPFVF